MQQNNHRTIGSINMERRRNITARWCCGIFLIGILWLPYYHYVSANPEKVASISPSHQHRRENISRWDHGQIKNILKRLENDDDDDSTSSVIPYQSRHGTSVRRMPFFLHGLNDIPSMKISHSSNRASKKFSEDEWKFYIPALSQNETYSFDFPSRALKQRQQDDYSSQSISSFIKTRKSDTLLKRFIDDYNFKGYGISIYKSLLYMKNCGIAFKIPILGNWDWWDTKLALPSLTFMLGIYYPFNISICLSTSMRTDVLKCWCTKFAFMMEAFMLQFVHHLLSAIWTIVSIILFPLYQKWLHLPFQLDHASTKAFNRRKEIQPAYKSDVQDRVGMSFWYKWQPLVGFTTRTSFWHIYLPTLEAYSQLLFGSNSDRLGAWWKSHFACLGTDIAVPNPIPPHFSLTSVLSLSGLRFKSLRKDNYLKSPTAGAKEQVKVTTFSQMDENSVQPKKIDGKESKKVLSSILHQQELNEETVEKEVGDIPLAKVPRGGNNKNCNLYSHGDDSQSAR